MLKDVRDGYISVNEAARRAGLSRNSVRVRLEPDHPDPIPVMRYENPGGKPSFRIPVDEFEKWLEAHRV